MRNQLAEATSPYLLQHSENPVAWRQWGEAALTEARERDVPIMLSIGYAACHWCHVMAHESFEDAETAELMNENFVNIKVDREERPDIDAVYMTATQAMTGQGGWPMTCFLTPDGEPFHCGTYYPYEPRPGIPSFQHVLRAVLEAWQERREELREGAGRIAEQLASQSQPLPESAVDAGVLEDAVSTLAGEADQENGGFGTAPKFPPSMVLEFLLRHHERTGSESALSLAGETMEGMARGGIFDQLGGGFARYAVDKSWTVPHFEKMLFDNALLLRAYAHMARRTGSALATRVATETAQFLLRELRTPQGGFAASLDADTEGFEGLTYVWTPQQLVDVLGDDDGAWAAEVFGVTDQGTFEQGKSTLRLMRDPADTDRFERVRAALLLARMSRPQPETDDKVVVAWNGLTITALAEAGVALQRPDWIDAARDAARFVLDTHEAAGRLRRVSRDGVVGEAAGVLEDYGCFAAGLLALHQATGEPQWLTSATRLLDTALEHFAGPEPGTYHDTADDAERLVQRPSDPTDNASPAGASSLAAALLSAAALAGPDRSEAYRGASERAMQRAGLVATRAPRFAGNWLSVAEASLAGPVQVAVVGADAGERAGLLHEAARGAHGGAVVLGGQPDADGVPLLRDRPLVDGTAAAYVCRGYVCDRPVTTLTELRTALAT